MLWLRLSPHDHVFPSVGMQCAVEGVSMASCWEQDYRCKAGKPAPRGTTMLRDDAAQQLPNSDRTDVRTQPRCYIHKDHGLRETTSREHGCNMMKLIHHAAGFNTLPRSRRRPRHAKSHPQLDLRLDLSIKQREWLAGRQLLLPLYCLRQRLATSWAQVHAEPVG